MKDKAIIGNIGHFDNEIDMAGLAKSRARSASRSSRSTTSGCSRPKRHASEHSILVLAEGRLLNLGCATGHPSFVMSSSFTNQVLAQLDLHFSATGKPTLSGTNYDAARLHPAEEARRGDGRPRAPWPTCEAASKLPPARGGGPFLCALAAQRVDRRQHLGGCSAGLTLSQR